MSLRMFLLLTALNLAILGAPARALPMEDMFGQAVPRGIEAASKMFYDAYESSSSVDRAPLGYPVSNYVDSPHNVDQFRNAGPRVSQLSQTKFPEGAFDLMLRAGEAHGHGRADRDATLQGSKVVFDPVTRSVLNVPSQVEDEQIGTAIENLLDDIIVNAKGSQTPFHASREEVMGLFSSPSPGVFSSRLAKTVQKFRDIRNDPPSASKTSRLNKLRQKLARWKSQS